MASCRPEQPLARLHRFLHAVFFPPRRRDTRVRLRDGRPTCALARTVARRLLIGLVTILCGILVSAPAHAIPSFAEQTGLTCAACHEGFPQLNDFGRAFKLNGYVLGGSLPSWKSFSGSVEVGFTHLNSGIEGGLAPGYPDNNAFAMQQLSPFYGGAIYAPIGLGAFVQYTYDGVDHVWHWDNTDIRLARTVHFLGNDVIVGVTANNAPTVSDPWNTLFSWGYPFITSSFGFGLGNFSPYIASLAQAVWGGGIYFDYADWLYGEFDLYRSLSNNQSSILNGGTASGISFPDASVYGRLALHHTFGKSSFEVGMFGLSASPVPDRTATWIRHRPDQRHRRRRDVSMDLR